MQLKNFPICCAHVEEFRGPNLPNVEWHIGANLQCLSTTNNHNNDNDNETTNRQHVMKEQGIQYINHCIAKASNFKRCSQRSRSTTICKKGKRVSYSYVGVCDHGQIYIFWVYGPMTRLTQVGVSRLSRESLGQKVARHMPRTRSKSQQQQSQQQH